MNTVTHLKTKVERWAEKISATYGDSVQAIIDVGRQLQQAKAECTHGEWGELTGETTGKPLLPFSPRTARMMKAIANNSALSNRQHAADLPAAWYTLAVLASLDPEDIEAAIADGAIHPEMQRKDAEALKARIQGPRIPAAPPPDPSPEPVAAPVITLKPAHMTPEQEAIWKEAEAECGRMIVDYAERQAETERVCADLSARFPVSAETQAAQQLALEILDHLKHVVQLLERSPVAPQFDEHWKRAADYLHTISKTLETAR